MAVGTKEQSIIFLALLIIYLGIYTLRAPGVPASSSSDLLWAGFFSITLGVFALLTVLFAQPSATDFGTKASSMNVYSLVAGVAFFASAFFNYKLTRALPAGNFKYMIYAQVVAHVLLLGAYFYDFGRLGQRVESIFRGPAGAATPAPLGTIGTPITPGFGLTSPRLPIRAR